MKTRSMPENQNDKCRGTSGGSQEEVATEIELNQIQMIFVSSV